MQWGMKKHIVLDAWAAKAATTSEIAKVIGSPRQSVNAILSIARRAGDPRAKESPEDRRQRVAKR